MEQQSAQPQTAGPPSPRRGLRARASLTAAALTVGTVVGSTLLAPAATAGADPLASPPGVTIAALAPASAPAEHSLHLASLPNGRDLGGYTTAEGRTTRSGVALRSGALNKLSDGDAAALQQTGLTKIIDLRTGIERAVQPDRVPAGAHELWLNVVGDDPLTLPALVDMPRLYRMFVTDPDAREAFRQAVLDIAYGDGAGLFHCSAGKDRTGWLAAVLLTLVGVDRTTVYDDYLASNELIGDGMAGSAAPALDAAGSTFINRVERGWLDTSFAAADEVYGGFDGYARAGLGLTDADIDALKSRLLV